MSTPEKLPISFVLIAHNEAANLPRCLDSVASWVSEIVIVVNDCTDDTIAIAKRYGAKVYEHPWHGFRDQKNIALEYATQPWVLFPDADEEVTPELAANIRDFVKRNDPDYDGAEFARCVFFLGRWIKHGDWYPDWCLRLFRRGKGKWGGSREHGKIELSGRVARLSGDLNHYSYRDVDHYLSKFPYYADIYLQRMLDEKVQWSPFSVAFRSFWRFFRAYFIRRGFLDGFPGLFIATSQGYSTFYRHSKLYEHLVKSKSGSKNGKP